jgi:UDP-MurNAc hydroxylase
MRFQILSHAGLSVSSGGKNLICDPWLIGSTYWRSWWNYPPVSQELLDSLKPDALYLTHIHWDHFAGPSLRLFDNNIPIYIPKEPAGRIARDLRRMGLNNIIEMEHGKPYDLGGGMRITSYHFFVFTDSGLVIEADDTVLLNANDAKLIGGPLKQLLNEHPKIDFVFRSHSSANSRICYEIIDDPQMVVDDRERYIENFAAFVQAIGAKHAIPFASNHCHLHKEVIDYNSYAVSQQEVADYFAEHNITEPEVDVMVSGDLWDSKTGFDIKENDWFTRRDEHILEYKEQVSDRLEDTYAKEAKAKVSMKRVEKYYDRVFKAMPYFMRRAYKNCPALYVLTAGDNTTLIEVDFWGKKVREIDSYTDESHPFQTHTQTALFNHCIVSDLFSHLAISKRVRYRVTRENYKRARMLAYFYNFFEYDLLPIKNIHPVRFIGGWLRRWRELLLYAHIGINALFGREFDYKRYLAAPKRS